MERSLLESLSDCVVLIQAKRKLSRVFKGHVDARRNKEGSSSQGANGSDYEIVSNVPELKTSMELQSHEQEAAGDAGEPSRKKQQGNTNKESSSVAKHDLVSKGQLGKYSEGQSAGGSLAGGAGGGKPPPRNNHKRNVQSKVAVSLDETDDNEEISLKKTKATAKVMSSNKAHADAAKSGQPGKKPLGTRGGSLLERYRKLSKSIKDERKPYANFKPKIVKKKSEEATLLNISQEPVPEDSTKPARYPARKEPLTFRGKKSVKLEVTEEKPVTNPPPSESSANTTEATENASLPSTSKTSITSRNSRDNEEDTSIVHWEEVLDPLEFSDSEISSDNEADDISVAEDIDKRQFDSEWLHLHWARSSFGKRRVEKNLQTNAFPKGKDVPNEPDFLSVMMPLYRFMMLLGRFPFKLKERADKKKRFLLVKSSSQYLSFFFTTILFGLGAGYASFNISAIYGRKAPFTIYNDVESIEMDKFWVDGVVSMLWMYFLFVSSVSLLIDGHNVAEFFNRWLDSLELIQYNATWGLRRRLFLVFFLLFIYFGLVVADFVADLGYIRGSRGFTGLLALDLFKDRIRLSLWGFRTSQLFGLVLDIYAILSAAFVMSLIGAHAWSLDIAARRFNLRLGLSLRTLCFKRPEDVPFQFRKLVPFRKLFAEYLIISTFPKIMGQAFIVVFNAFFLFIMFAIVAACYAFYSTVLLSDPFLGDKEFNVSGIQRGHFVPVKENLHPGIRFLKDASLSAGLWIICVVFLELVGLPGGTIMSGSRYVHRKGFTRCKTVFERRFVASMIYSYAPQGHSHVRPGFGVDRAFIAKFLGFTFGLFMTVFQFNPSRLEFQSFMSCDSLLECRVVTLPKKLASHSSFHELVSINTRNDTPQKGNIEKEPPIFTDFFTKFPCSLSGLRPVDLKDYTETCNEIPIPVVFTAAPVNGFYSRAPSCPHYYISQSDASTKKLYDCFGGQVNISNTDECGNLYLPTPSQESQDILLFSPQMPNVQLTTLTFEDSDTSESVCCFAYSGLREKDSASDNHCNLPEGKVPKDRCQKKSAATVKDRELWETALRDGSAHSDHIDKEGLVACLCQGIGGLPKASSSWDPCKDLHEKINLKASTTTKPDLDKCELPTKVVKKMCACANDPFRNLSLSSFLHQRKADNRDLNMYQICSIDPKTDYFALGVALLPRVYPDPFIDQIGTYVGPDLVPGKPSCVNERRKPLEDTFPNSYDCFGNEVNALRVDDCGNYGLSYPDEKGREKKPFLMEVILLNSDDEFACCWNYFVEGFNYPENKRLLANGFCGLAGFKPDMNNDIALMQSCAIRQRNTSKNCNEVLSPTGINELYVKKFENLII